MFLRKAAIRPAHTATFLPRSQMNNTVHTKYDPNPMIDSVMNKLQLKNDAAVARTLKVAPPIIAKVRNRNLPVGGYLLMRLGEVTGMSVRDIQALMGDRRVRCRMPGMSVRRPA
jgi:hypothetical protein